MNVGLVLFDIFCGEQSQRMKLTNVKWKQFENFESFLRLQSFKVFNGVIEILTIVLFIEKRKRFVFRH